MGTDVQRPGKREGLRIQVECEVSVRQMGQILKTYNTIEELQFLVDFILAIVKMSHGHPKCSQFKVYARCIFANYLDLILHAYANNTCIYVHTYHSLESYMLMKLG